MEELLVDETGKPLNGITKRNKSKLYDDVSIRDEKVCARIQDCNGNTIYKPIANYIGVKGVVENIETGKMEAILTYDDCQEKKEIPVSLGDIARKSSILNLAEKGVDVNEINAKYIIKHLRNEREKAQKKLVHSNIGFYENDRGVFYKHYKIIGKNKEIDIASEYTGSISIAPKGSKEKWKDMIDREVVGTPPLELALVIGFSAPLVGLIADISGIEIPLIHIYGDSTQGKTTAAMLAVSAFGSPNIREDGLLMTWNTTVNGMHSSVGGNTGIPIVFDESSMANMQDFSNVIYSITSGKEKIRSNEIGKLRPRMNWKTTIISTGEHSIFTKTKANTGIHMRLIEFGNITWTKSASQSELIKETVIANYGHYGLIFARCLMKLGKERVCGLLNKCKEDLLKKMENAKTNERLAGKLSILITTATLLKQYLKINLNIEEIQEIILKNDEESKEIKDIDERAYDMIMQKVAENSSKFAKRYEYAQNLNTPAKDRDTWGIVEYKGSVSSREVQIVIIENVFYKLLKENGFEEPKVILKELKRKNMLDYENGKYYRKRVVGDIGKVHCYVIKVKHEDVPERRNMYSDSNLDDMGNP